MQTFEAETTLVELSEPHNKWKTIQARMKKGRVIVSQRNAPVAALIPLEELREMEALFDKLEDYALALKASERLSGTKEKDYRSLDDVLKKFG